MTKLYNEIIFMEKVCIRKISMIKQIVIWKKKKYDEKN